MYIEVEITGLRKSRLVLARLEPILGKSLRPSEEGAAEGEALEVELAVPSGDETEGDTMRAEYDFVPPEQGWPPGAYRIILEVDEQELARYQVTVR
jgi:hypothetical protein